MKHFICSCMQRYSKNTLSSCKEQDFDTYLCVIHYSFWEAQKFNYLILQMES